MMVPEPPKTFRFRTDSTVHGAPFRTVADLASPRSRR